MRISEFKEEERLLYSRQAEDRSKVYNLLSRFFMERPRKKMIEMIRSEGFRMALRSTSESADIADLKQGAKLVEMFLNSISDQPEDDVELSMAVDFTRLFRGVRKDYGPPPPYESVWRGESQVMGPSTEEVLRFYADSGIGLDMADELPDYIGVELRFMALLCLRESKAWKDNDSDGLRRYISQEKAFVVNHILQWVPRYLDAMAEDAQTGFYKGVALLTKGFLCLEKEYLEVLD